MIVRRHYFMADNKKVFISYSWAVQERVIELAERLIANGIDVILDVYDLKEGQDKYAFMEQSVNDPSVDRVLIICDKTYTDKANNRDGGVGDETAIISPEIYGQVKQEKFIPIIFEVDENNQAYCPHYIKSRIYIDLSTEDDSYEVEYEKLLRNIYEKPLYSKPALGTKPEWLENEKVDLSIIRDLVKQIRGYTGGNNVKADFLLRKSIEEFVNAAKMFEVSKVDELIAQIDSTKPFRDIFVDFGEALIFSSMNISETIATLFEELYNQLHDTSDKQTYSDHDFELYDYIIWELFITITIILLHYKKYSELYNILTHTYFLRQYNNIKDLKPYSYFKFRQYFRTIERVCKPKSTFPNNITLSGHILIGREKKPIITKDTISNADIVLYQLGSILNISDDEHHYWFPTTYIYHEHSQPIWQKLKSKEYCKSILPLFNVKTIDELKKLISLHPIDTEMKYTESYYFAPAILSSIDLDDIATLN